MKYRIVTGIMLTLLLVGMSSMGFNIQLIKAEYAPVAVFTYSPENPLVNQIVTFNASASYDDDGYIVSYVWFFGDGTNATGMIVNHTYTAAGNYIVGLLVSDNDGLTDSTWHFIGVGPPEGWHPWARFTYSPKAPPHDPIVNQTVTFDASQSNDKDGYIVNYTWNFGDGNITTVTESITTHVYNATGTYDVTLIVTDNDQLTSSPYTITIRVIAPPTAWVYVDPPRNYAALGQTFSINVSIANVTNLSGFDFQLYYNTTILNAIELVIHPFLNEPTMVPKKEVNDEYNATHGRVWVAIGSFYPAEAVNGSGTLATITFQVAAVGRCVLDLRDTKLSDWGTPIAHSTEDGYFEYTPYEHDIAAFLEAPGHLMPGNSALLNATVLNGGLNNETDVELQLLINGSIVNSTVINFLQVDSSYTISYLWTTTMTEAAYNVTAYVLPVPDEDFTLNNMKSARVPVSYIIRVPFHYQTIQKAIDAANPGDKIFVSAGIYYERLTIDKSLTLVGEESNTPIIDGSGGGYVIHVKADNVDISKFTIQNGYRGIELGECGYNTIKDNRITNNWVGISLLYSDSNRISGNIVSNNNECGVALDCSKYNTIKGNTIINNGADFPVGAGVYFSGSTNNTIYHNSFINNKPYQVRRAYGNTWDNGCEGNYWSDYNGTDINGDGIGDTLLPHQGVDYYPLMNPYIEGDVNHDAIVDIFDMVTIAIVYGSRLGDPNWNPHADLNEDKIIDINDIVIAAIHFGEKW